VTLFPQALLPLYIFEPRYRQMLCEVLHSTRMFAVAMQRPRTTRESPSQVAGLGLVRAAVTSRDGTSHLILQGLARLELGQTVRYKPYRVHRVRPLATPPCDTVKVDALVAKVRELLERRINLGLPFPFPVMAPGGGPGGGPPHFSPKEILRYLDSIANPEHAADLVSCAVLPAAFQRQAILETVDVESRLRQLIFFMLAEMRSSGKPDQP
jgi:ATP-dependent Lon protease